MGLALIIAVGGVISVIVVMALRRRAPRPSGLMIEGSKPGAPTAGSGSTAASDAHAVDAATAAAIGLALTLETASPMTSRETTAPSAWAMAGRLQQLNRWPR